MKRIRTAALAAATLAAAPASARGYETILENDPNGVIVTIISVTVVLSALIVLFILIYWFGRIMIASAEKRVARTMGVEPKSAANPGVANGEVVAAIAMAMKLFQEDLHDKESDVITINKVARAYSPWSSKIHGLTQMPQRISNRK